MPGCVSAHRTTRVYVGRASGHRSWGYPAFVARLSRVGFKRALLPGSPFIDALVVIPSRYRNGYYERCPGEARPPLWGGRFESRPIYALSPKGDGRFCAAICIGYVGRLASQPIAVNPRLRDEHNAPRRLRQDAGTIVPEYVGATYFRAAMARLSSIGPHRVATMGRRSPLIPRGIRGPCRGLPQLRPIGGLTLQSRLLTARWFNTTATLRGLIPR
jgi:hypothetical protein